MENNKKIKLIELIMGALLALILLIVIGFAYKMIFMDKVNITSDKPSITFKEDKYEKVTNPTNYGTPISTSEEGFGRENPFLPYK